MATPEFGKDKILAIRKLSDATTAEGIKLALQIEHTLTYERDTEQKQTKDGAINTDGGLSVELELTAVSTKDEANDLMRDSVVNGEVVEFWEIDLSSKDDQGQYDALYMRGVVTSWESPASVEDTIDISTTVPIEGVPIAGKVTLTEEQSQQLQYAFFGLEKVVDV